MDPVLAIVLRSALALLFASALAHKLRDLPRFVAIVEDYEIGPRALARPLALGVALGEAGAAIAFALGLAFAPLLGLALIGTYSAAIGVNLARGRRDIDCGCGGPEGHRLGPELLVRNGLLALAAVLALVPTTDRALGALDATTIALALIFVALAWSAAGRLASLHAGSSRERIPS